MTVKLNPLLVNPLNEPSDASSSTGSLGGREVRAAASGVSLFGPSTEDLYHIERMRSCLKDKDIVLSDKIDPFYQTSDLIDLQDIGNYLTGLIEAVNALINRVRPHNRETSLDHEKLINYRSLLGAYNKTLTSKIKRLEEEQNFDERGTPQRSLFSSESFRMPSSPEAQGITTTVITTEEYRNERGNIDTGGPEKLTLPMPRSRSFEWPSSPTDSEDESDIVSSSIEGSRPDSPESEELPSRSTHPIDTSGDFSEEDEEELSPHTPSFDEVLAEYEARRAEAGLPPCCSEVSPHHAPSPKRGFSEEEGVFIS